MISLKIGGIIVAAFIAGAFVASPELRAYAANTVFSTDIVDGEVKSVDIANGGVANVDIATNAITTSKINDGAVKTADIGNGEVRAADIATNAVTGNKIADGTIGYRDLSRSLIAVEHRDDCNCGGTGWDPNGTSQIELIYDTRITPLSVVSVTDASGSNIVCWTATPDPDGPSIDVICNTNIPEGTEINYAIFNPQ